MTSTDLLNNAFKNIIAANAADNKRVNDILLKNAELLSKFGEIENELKCIRHENDMNKQTITNLTKEISLLKNENREISAKYEMDVHQFEFYMKQDNEYKTKMANEIFMHHDCRKTTHVQKFYELKQYININNYDMMTYIINTYIASDCYADKYFSGNVLKHADFISNVIYFVKDNINTIYITPENTNMSFSYEYILLLFSFSISPLARKEIYLNGLRLLKKCGINLECKYHIYELDDDTETPNKIYVNIYNAIWF